MVFNDKWTKYLLGPEIYEKLSSINILIIGAGGIGCELIKNLILCGVQNIVIVDLDLIDITNLNRQFFYKKSDVGKSKADIACKAALLLNENANIKSYHADIRDRSLFDDTFWRNFDLILNALDNNESRIYVNEISIRLDILLIDSGSTGYNGQVTPILKDVTKCFECYPLSKTKSYAVCTIRSMPSRPEHCIAWAKILFNLLFGPLEDTNILIDLQENLNLKSLSADTNLPEFTQNIINVLFREEIIKQSTFECYSRFQAPRPIDLAILDFADKPVVVNKLNEFDVWPINTTLSVLYHTIIKLFNLSFQESTKLIYSKENQLANEFVGAAANLRMYNYNIPMISRWKSEEITRSIIPAVASTNAIVAGIQTQQALSIIKNLSKFKKKILKSPKELMEHNIKHVWVKESPSGPYILIPEKLDYPNSACFTCQSLSYNLFVSSIQKWKLEDFVEKIVIEELKCKEPQIELIPDNNKSACIYNIDMIDDIPDFQLKLKLPLKTWIQRLPSQLLVLDYSFSTHFECKLFLNEDINLQGFEYLLKRLSSNEVETKSSQNVESDIIDNDFVEFVPTKKKQRNFASENSLEILTID